MTEEKLEIVLKLFADEVKKIYGSKLRRIILYGSCARGDFMQESNIDVMILLSVPQDEISVERKRILDVTDQLDLEYDVVLAPVFQNEELFRRYLPISGFYQNVQRDGIKISGG